MKRIVAGVLLLALALAGCGGAEPWNPADGRTPEAADGATVDPDQPLGWGPTVGELEQARAMVAEWTPRQLAGQVIVGRFHGTDPDAVGRMVADLHLAGVSVQSENAVDADQVRRLNAAVAEAVAADGREFGPIIGVDHEGGTVAHLRGIATDYPAFARAGDAIAADEATGREVVRSAAHAMGLELRGLGFTWIWAPVADVTIGTADPTIGSRSPSSDPQIAAIATEESVNGYNSAGIVSTTKHFPGHGAVTKDSHYDLPELDATLAELVARDLVPFRAAVAAGAPSIMMAHVAVEALEADKPATLAAPVYELLADELEFEGVVITDSMGMGALMGHEVPVVAALVAGADLLLMPANTEIGHANVTRAIRKGDIPRERILDAAASVVALQLWQQRIATEVAVPDDAAERARQAAAALAAAG